MKYIVYYAIRIGGRVNRDYPEYTSGTDVRGQWLANPSNAGRHYLWHEEHDVYTKAYADAGMIGADEDDRREWLRARVHDLREEAARQHAAQQAKMIPGNANVYGDHKVGDVVKDQNGRYGKVPEVPLEVFRNKPINPDVAMDAVRSASKSSASR